MEGNDSEKEDDGVHSDTCDCYECFKQHRRRNKEQAEKSKKVESVDGRPELEIIVRKRSMSPDAPLMGAASQEKEEEPAAEGGRDGEVE